MFTHWWIGNHEKTHRLDTHDEERRVFINGWCCVQWFSASIYSTRNQSWMGEEDPDGIERDGEEVPE